MPNKVRESLDRSLCELKADDGLALAVRERMALAERRQTARVLVGLGLAALLAVGLLITGLMGAFGSHVAWVGEPEPLPTMPTAPTLAETAEATALATTAPKPTNAPVPAIVVAPAAVPTYSGQHGLALKLVSAVRDQDTWQLELMLTDTTKNRLSGQTSLPGFAISADGAAFTKIVPYPQASAYNPVTHTATFSVRCDTPGWPMTDRFFVRFDTVMIETQYLTIDATDMVHRLIAENGESQWPNATRLPRGEQQLSLPDANLVLLTNAGFLSDGLHIQSRWLDQQGEYGWWMLEDTRTGELFSATNAQQLGVSTTTETGELLEYRWTQPEVERDIVPYRVLLQLNQGPRLYGDWQASAAVTQAQAKAPGSGDAPADIATQHDIALRLLSAQHDQDAWVVEFELQDMTSNRLGSDMFLPGLSLSGDGQNFVEILPYPMPIAYDGLRKTATFRVVYLGREFPQAARLYLRVANVIVRGENMRVDATEAVRQAIAQRTATAPGGDQRSLPRGDQRVTLPGVEGMVITNAGFVRDNLHIQTRWENTHTREGWWTLTDMRTQANYPASGATGHVLSQTANQETMQMEYVWEQAQLEASLAQYQVLLEMNQNAQWIGDWLVSTAGKALPGSKEVPLDMTVDALRLDMLRVSPLGATLIGYVGDGAEGDIRKALDRIGSIRITWKNGDQTLLRGPGHLDAYQARKAFQMKFVSAMPLDMDRIAKAEVVLND